MPEPISQTSPSYSLLGVDIGGTTIKARVIADDGALLAQQKLATPKSDTDARRSVSAIVELKHWAQSVATSRDLELRAIGLVTPGIVDPEAGVVQHSFNLGWRNVPILATVREALVAEGEVPPIGFGQDVRAGALAELTTASTQWDTPPNGVFVAVGTGVAAALTVAGELVSGAPWAGEIGQLRILSGDHAGQRIEDIVTGIGLAQRLGEPGVPEVIARVRGGDRRAIDEWQDFLGVLADLLAMLTVVNGASMVVLGGGIALAGAELFDPLTQALQARLGDLPMPSLRAPRYGSDAGAVGACLLAAAALRQSGGHDHGH